MRIHQVQALDDPFGATPGGVATLGVFDGVHLGHRRILERCVARARSAGRPALVLTFAVHPVVVVKGLPPRLITSLPHRLRLFDRLGIDECVVLPFDEQVRQVGAAEFAERVFVQALALAALVLGPDARIGHEREGDLDFIARFCATRGLELEVVDDLRIDGARVSSTRIRAAVADGDLERASRMLGRPFSMLGTVVPGEGRGRKLGFATANLDLHHEIRPPAGVYAVRARFDGRDLPAVVNIGIRPTFGPDGDLTVEAHLLDFTGDLYGMDLEIVPVARLRDEMQFASGAALIEQIHADVRAARQVLGT